VRCWLVALGALTGCQVIFGVDHVHLVDSGTDATKIYLDAPPPGTLCAGQASSPLHICAPEATLQGVTYSTDVTIDTDVDAMCTTVAAATGMQGELCEVIATDLTIEGGARLTAAGSRPLVLVAMGTLTIAGTVDVSSHRTPDTRGAGADDASCDVRNGPVQASGTSTSGGGAGGSFGSLGGAGGAPADGVALMPSLGVGQGLALVRGGCRGGAGGTDHSGHTAVGGHSGGAVYLMAGTSVVITGAVLANGAAGAGGASTIATDYAGGAAGGSGGLIMLDTPSLSLSGVLMANGGGGGAGCSDNASAGNPGAEPKGGMPGVPAAGGGTTGDGTGGAGGAGATDSLPGPGGFGDPAGSLHTGAGGGGGGGKGIIRVFGSAPVGGTIVPAAS